MNNTGYDGKQLSYIKKKKKQLKIKNSSARWNMKPYIARKKADLKARQVRQK